MRSSHGCVKAVTPEDKPHVYARSFPIPHDWLPEEGERKCWWKADAMALSAVQSLNLEAKYYWFIESDVAATPEVWKSFFKAHENNDADCLATHIGTRGPHSTFRHWGHPATPPDARKHFIMAVYRLSHRALEASIAMAPELRETFSEVSVPYVILKSGLTMAQFKPGFFDIASMVTKPQHLRINPAYLNHPVKDDRFIR